MEYHIQINVIKSGKLKKRVGKIQSWVYNQPHFVYPPLTNKHINIKDHITGEVMKTQKIRIQIHTRDLHNNLIKYSSDNVLLIQDMNQAMQQLYIHT